MATYADIIRELTPRKLRDCLRSPLSTLKWAALAVTYRAGWRPRLRVRTNWEFPCHPVAYSFGYRTQIDNAAEAEEFDTFLAEIVPGICLFDVGAHFGIFSMAALHFGGPTAQVVAVEPSPSVASVLSGQASILGLADRLTLFRGACSATDGHQEFVSTAFSASRQFIMARDQVHKDRTTVESITIDTLAKRLNVTPTHIKIDVEGAEHDVLVGAAETLSHVPGPVLFLELHNNVLRRVGSDPQETLDWLGDKGYSVVRPDQSMVAELLAQPVARLVLKRVLPGK